MQVTPSTFQVNEGDSLTTSLSGFTPGSTLYFKVGGRGISKKDFAAGGVKGSIKVDANGVATIPHALTADKATEGDESFAIQVFSDKKMRNLLGKSDAVTVFDTSVKAPKAGKPPKDGGGGSSGGGGGKAPVARSILIDGIQLVSDQTYTSDSPIGKLLLKYGQNALAVDDDGRRLADPEVDPITGYRPFVPPAGAVYKWEMEISEDYVVVTAQYASGVNIGTARSVWIGNFGFTGQRLTSFTFTEWANAMVEPQLSPDGPYGGYSVKADRPETIYPLTFGNLDNLGDMLDYTVTSEYGEKVSNSEMPGLQTFGGGKFFYNGWDADPFASNLI
jgi:hypothetical protein